jgi:ubiquinone/menaquinone biosynthesis C-methylase UbiE
LVRAGNHPYRLLIQASVTDLPFADRSFGGIASIETLEHVAEMSPALTECARCLKPKGHLIVSMPSVTLRSLWEMHRLRAPVYCSAEEHVRELSPITLKGFRNKFQTFKWFEKELARCGFETVRKSGVGFVFPMWRGALSWMEHAMNLLYRENINNIFAKLHFFRQFPYYRLYLARLNTA